MNTLFELLSTVRGGGNTGGFVTKAGRGSATDGTAPPYATGWPRSKEANVVVGEVEDAWYGRAVQHIV